MIQIRKSTFETNSSSTHSLVMCDEKTWDDFAAGKLYYNVLSRYHEEYLEKYPLDKYKWVPEDSCLNDLPIFCTFKQIKQHVSAYYNILNHALFERKNITDDDFTERIHRVASDALFLEETFYTIDELEGFEYDRETHKADLDYYFG